jgi:hypothetical protein
MNDTKSALCSLLAAVLLLLLKSAFITRVQVPYDLYAPRLTEWRIGLLLTPFVLLFARFLSLDRAPNWCLWLLAVLGWMLQAYLTLAGLAPGEHIPRRDRGFPIIAIALTWLVLRLGRDRQR